MRTKKRNVWYMLCISTMILTLLYANLVYSRSTADYTIEKSVVDGGGGVRSSESYTLSHSIGQPGGVGIISTSQYTNYAGFYGSSEVSTPRYTL